MDLTPKELLVRLQDQLSAINRCIRIAYQAEYRSQHREKAREKAKEYYSQNKEKIRAQVAEYRSQNKEKLRAERVRYRQGHREEIRLRKGRYKRKQRARLGDGYLRHIDNSQKLDPHVHRASLIMRRILKGEMNVEQANRILERTGATARIQAPDEFAG